ncbi:uncharacterized protein LOC131610998 [Vicia villosa]|uniref:uncharacterized protein LOC131610998 n=1 Tax=Vicia villosa TaxID=3911 RepID=UPI00273AC3E7|nr:uncharacterized protein LOC131610998 [Vicia villosa]
MPQKYLHQLLKEDQEPFLLKNYISDRRNQLKITTINKIQNSNSNVNFNINLCKNASCFFSFPETPDFRKSPLFELTSPVKSPCKSSRTAALLLEAALRIQKHSSSSSSNHKSKTKGFGLFGSLFKRIKQRNQNRKREIENENVSIKDILSSKKFDSQERNKSLPFETETSCSGYSERIIHEACACYHSSFSESPFRFVLQTSSCSGSHTPELASPSRRITEDKGSNGEVESINQFRSGEEEEEDKEQCSPVCVLDPPFEDDEEGHINDDDDDDDDGGGGGFDLSSYANVQRARQKILYKLRRFEKLAGLDPLELEKRMLEDEEDEEETYMEEDDDEDEESEVSCKENDFKELVFEAVYMSMVHDRQQMPQEFKKLIYDLILEEEREFNSLEDRDMVIANIYKRMESWKEVESNTIDMMIEEDFSVENGGWKKNVEQIRNMAGELEFDIFSILVKEFSEELVC